MPSKLDSDARTGDKLLRLFRKLLFDNRRHFQQDLARELNCSPQTVIRLMEQIESAVGIALEMGTEQRRRWYRLNPGEKGHLGLDFEELRILPDFGSAEPTVADRVSFRLSARLLFIVAAALRVLYEFWREKVLDVFL